MNTYTYQGQPWTEDDVAARAEEKGMSLEEYLKKHPQVKVNTAGKQDDSLFETPTGESESTESTSAAGSLGSQETSTWSKVKDYASAYFTPGNDGAQYATSQLERKKEELARKSSGIWKNEHTDYESNIKNILNDSDIVGQSLSDIIGTDQYVDGEPNWTYILPKEKGGEGESVGFTKSSAYDKLRKFAWKNIPEGSEFTETDFDKLFKNLVTDKATKQKTDILAAEEFRVQSLNEEEAGEIEKTGLTTSMHRKSLDYDIPFNTVQNLWNTKNKIVELTSKKDKTQKEIIELDKLKNSFNTARNEAFGEKVSNQFSWDGTHVNSKEDADFVYSQEEMDNAEREILNGVTPETKHDYIKRLFNHNLKQKHLNTKDGKELFDVTINNFDAFNLLDRLKIKSTGSNDMGRTYSLTKEQIAKHYGKLVKSEGDISELNPRIGQSESMNYSSPDGFFSLTEHVDKHDFSAWQKFWDQGEFAENDPSRQFKREVKDFANDRKELVRDGKILGDMHLFNLDPASRKDEWKNKMTSLEGTMVGDFVTHSAELLRPFIVDETDLAMRDFSDEKTSRRTILDNVEAVAFENDIELTDTQKDDMERSVLYKSAEGVVQFLPAIAEFAVYDVMLKKTGAITGIPKLLGAAGRFMDSKKKVVGIKKMRQLAKGWDTKVGSALFNDKMLKAGYAATKGSKGALAKTMNFGYHGIIEEGKMYAAFDEDYHVGGGLAFYGTGKALGGIFKKAWKPKSNEALSFMGLTQSGTAGMMSTQMAGNLEAFIADLRGKETLQTHINETYANLGEVGQQGIVDFLVFSAIGARGVLGGPKGARGLGMYSTTRMRRTLKAADKRIIELENKEKPTGKEKKEHQDLYELRNAIQGRVDIIDRTAENQNPETKKKNIESQNEAFMKAANKDSKEKLKIEVVDKSKGDKMDLGENSTAEISADGNSIKIDVNSHTDGKLPHEGLHWLAGKKFKDAPAAFQAWRNTLRSSFKDMKFQIGGNNKGKEQGKETRYVDLEAKLEDRYGKKADKLTAEEYNTYITEFLADKGTYAELVGKNVFRNLQQGINRFANERWGVNIFNRNPDLTKKQDLLDFLGNYAQSVRSSTVTAKQLDMMAKITNDVKWKESVNHDGRSTKEKVDAATKPKGKRSEDLNRRRAAHTQDVYEKRILPIADKDERVKAIQDFMVNPRNTYKDPITGKRGMGSPIDNLVRRVAEDVGNKWKFDRGQKESLYAELMVDPFNKAAIKRQKEDKAKGIESEFMSKRGVVGIIESYRNYKPKEGADKQELSKRIFNGIKQRATEIIERGVGKSQEKKELGFERTFDEVKEGDLGYTEQREFDAPGTKLPDNIKKAELVKKFDITKSEYDAIEGQMLDVLSELPLRDMLRSRNLTEPMAELIEPILAKRFGRGEGVKKKDYYQVAKDYAFKNNDWLYDGITKQLDMNTAEGTFAMKTFGKFFEPIMDLKTGKQKEYLQAEMPKGLKEEFGGYDISASKKRSHPPLFAKIDRSRLPDKALYKFLFEGDRKDTHHKRVDQLIKNVSKTFTAQMPERILNDKGVQEFLKAEAPNKYNALKANQIVTSTVRQAKSIYDTKRMASENLSRREVDFAIKDRFAEEISSNVAWRKDWKEQIEKIWSENPLYARNIDLKEVFKVKEKVDEFIKSEDFIPLWQRGSEGKGQKVFAGKNMGEIYNIFEAVGMDATLLKSLDKRSRADKRRDPLFMESVWGDAMKTIASFLPPKLVNTSNFRAEWGGGKEKFFGSNKVLSATEMKATMEKHDIKGDENIKLTKEQEWAVDNYKIIDNSDAKRATLALFLMPKTIEFTNKKGKKVKRKILDPTKPRDTYRGIEKSVELQEKAIKEVTEKLGLTEDVVKANQIVLQMRANAYNSYLKQHKNKNVALDNLIFHFGEQTNVGNGSIRGLATHRSFTIKGKELVEEYRKDFDYVKETGNLPGRSEHGLPAMVFSMNMLANMYRNRSERGNSKFNEELKSFIDIYRQDVITSKQQKASDYNPLTGERTNTDVPPEILRAGSESNWLKRTADADYQLLLYRGFQTMGERRRANVGIGNAIDVLRSTPVGKAKASENLNKADAINRLSTIDKAFAEGRKRVKEKRGMSTFDFDETVGISDNYVIARKGKETKKIASHEWPHVGDNMVKEGWKMDFSDFNKVTKGKPGPLMQKMKNQIEKFGPDNVFILTARAQESAPAIHAWLKSEGVKIPLKNITGLGNSTGEAKAMWMLEKFSEGYNDMYFVDDAMPNVKAVRDVLNQLDIKSKVQQAKASEDLSSEFNKILQDVKGVKAYKKFSTAKAGELGRDKGKYKFFGSAGAEDFMGLTTYAFSGKGKKGEAQQEFFRKNLEDTYSRAYNNIHKMKQSISNDYKALRKTMPNVVSKLNKKIPGSSYTYDTAIRTHRWTRGGFEIPGMSKTDVKKLNDIVNKDIELSQFSKELGLVTKRQEGWVAPKEYWRAENITADLNNVVDRVYRKEALAEFTENREAIFGKWKGGRIEGANMNKIEAMYGSKHREALENMLWRMENGTNRTAGSDSNTNRWMNWVNNSVGAIMFFNQKSAALQTISSLNYVNGTFNNPIAAGKAFVNTKQYSADFVKIWNSDMMQQRRSGLKINLEACEMVSRVSTGGNKAKNALAYVLEKGFIPTKYADSFAIASGGATFYRNSIKKYKKQGMSEKQAEKQAWEDFAKITEQTQQSSRPDLISMQQASALGRPILAFANTPMQMFRRHKRRVQDIANNRGNMKENIASALYYGFAQTILFSYLANAMFAVDEDSDEDFANKKQARHVNTVADSYLRGMGTGGAAAAALKNGFLTFMRENEKDYNADYANVVVDMLNVSPPIGSKARKLHSAGKTWKYNKDVIPGMGLSLDNPGLLAGANVVSALTNVPVDRAVMKSINIKDASNSDFETWQRIAMLWGLNKWTLGLRDGKVQKLKKKKKSKFRKVIY